MRMSVCLFSLVFMFFFVDLKVALSRSLLKGVLMKFVNSWRDLNVRMYPVLSLERLMWWMDVWCLLLHNKLFKCK